MRSRVERASTKIHSPAGGRMQVHRQVGVDEPPGVEVEHARSGRCPSRPPSPAAGSGSAPRRPRAVRAAGSRPPPGPGSRSARRRTATRPRRGSAAVHSASSEGRLGGRGSAGPVVPSRSAAGHVGRPHPPGPRPHRDPPAGLELGLDELDRTAGPALVRVHVLGPVRRDRLAHRLDGGVEADEAGDAQRTRRPSPSTPPSSLPSSAAISVAATRMHGDGRRRARVSNVASFTSTTPPSRTFGSTGAQYSSCIAIADQVRDTSGGAAIGPSPTTTVPSVFIAAHRAAVHAEEHHVATLERRARARSPAPRAARPARRSP